MLRITVQDYHGAKRFIIEGKLAGDCVSELERCWQAAGAEHLEEGILVDLSSVTFIDELGKQLLSRMYQQGIRLEAKGLLPKCLLAEIEANGR